MAESIISDEFDAAALKAAGTSFSDNSSEWGYTVGVGWERAITNSWHFGLESRYTAFTDIGASSSSSTDVCFDKAACWGGANIKTSDGVLGDYDEWSVRARLIYHFGAN
jgi:opacity protein-like surface antigen